MEFAVSGVTINPLFLASIGFVVGVLGGFFGVGGGFVAGPLMFWAGVPFNFVVGTDLAHMTGKSIVAAQRHRRLGHLDLKLGLLMAVGTIIGIELGAQLIEFLERLGRVDLVIGTAYIVLLLSISLFTSWESVRALRLMRRKNLDGEVLGFSQLRRLCQRVTWGPMVSLPASGIAEISLWIVLGISVVTGLLAGALGVGGGFVRVPLLIYALGVPTHVAIGTDLFEIVISAGFGTLSHAVKGNVDILMALVMQTGAAAGAQIGASATRFFSGPRIRLVFALLPLVGVLLVGTRLLSGGGH